MGHPLRRMRRDTCFVGVVSVLSYALQCIRFSQSPIITEVARTGYSESASNLLRFKWSRCLVPVGEIQNRQCFRRNNTKVLTACIKPVFQISARPQSNFQQGFPQFSPPPTKEYLGHVKILAHLLHRRVDVGVLPLFHFE